MIRKTMLWLGALLVVGVAVNPLLTLATNCGGNSDALAAVRTYATLAQAEALASPDHAFRVTSATAWQREQLARLPGAAGHRRGHFLVATGAVPAASTARRVIIVCDTPYTDVPRRWFGSAPPAHAAGFADGSTGLLTPREFAALDRASFVTLQEL